MRAALALLPFAALAGSAHAETKAEAPLQIVERQILSIVTDDAGQPQITPTNKIPYIVGRSCYNWAIRFKPVGGDILFSETLILPGPAETWNTTAEQKTEVDKDRTFATTERHFDGKEGFASAGWCIVKNDPVGTYQYVIHHRSKEVARFTFLVGDLH